ncbi:hypothetical protein DLE01_10025 [Streptomyces sp. FT05W]|nr:hypothetical protein [Streptomyces sp. SID7815]PWS51733.1 hypothetical protein DLE01_10025 [Streptomyces sp. FT05W]QBR10482.1 hypothetical protein D7Y56_18510 [Streptomyces sp. S501]TPN02262.1 hypothetical protein FKO01_49985 [Mesorhizobium sp. B2-3-3]WKV82264.1 hypothetical protein HBB06_11745 [Streptomyces sp. SNU607]
MGIDHGVANLERHVTGTPSVAIQSNTRTASPEWRFRRSGHISGLDNCDTNVLREASGRRYSQVGAGARPPRNTRVTHAGRPPEGAERPVLSVSAW